MPEPTGHTIDGAPWEDARGPRLPEPVDRLARRLPTISWIFWILAVLDLGWHIVQGGGSGVSIATMASVLPCLIGAALFARHPQAWRTHRQLAVGAILFAVVEAMRIAQVVFAAGLGLLGPDADGVAFLSFGTIAWWTGAEVLGVLGLLYLGFGLAAARRGVTPDGFARRARIITVIPVLIAVVTMAVTAISYARSETGFESFRFTLYAVLNLGGAIATVFAWAYLTRMATAGSMAGDRPTRAWRLASIGGVVVLAGYLIDNALFLLATLIMTPDTDLGGLVVVLSLISLARAVGLGILLAGFVLGLPSEDQPPA